MTLFIITLDRRLPVMAAYSSDIIKRHPDRAALLTEGRVIPKWQAAGMVQLRAQELQFEKALREEALRRSIGLAYLLTDHYA